MTPEQEALAEKAIQAHKENDGVLNWHQYFYFQENSPLPKDMPEYKKSETVDLIQDHLVHLGLIKRVGSRGIKTLLTPDGFQFIGFEKQRRKLAKKEREERVKSWPQRYWWVFVAAAYVSGVATPLIVEYSKRKIWPESSQSPMSTPSIKELPADTYKNRSSFDTSFRTR